MVSPDPTRSEVWQEDIPSVIETLTIVAIGFMWAALYTYWENNRDE